MRPGSVVDSGVSDGLILMVLLSASTTLGLVWVWGGLSGALFGRGWPHLGVTSLLGVVFRLPAHLSDPALAWPAGARRLLPGTLGLYGTLGLLAPGVTGAAVVLGRRLPTLLSFGGPGDHDAGGSRWATPRELRTLARRSFISRARSDGTDPTTGRLTLGSHRNRLLRAEDRHALIAFGPPQSGKSAGLAIPALLEWEGPAIASSIKTDLLSATLERRGAVGDVFVFDPFSLSGVTSHTWSPLGTARTWDGALEAAWRLAAAGELDQRGVEGGDFWAIAAEQRLAPLLYAAARTDRQIGEVVAWAYGQRATALNEALDHLLSVAGNEEERIDALNAYEATRAFEAQAERTRSSIESTLQALLRAYRFTRVARSADGCEITAERLLSGSSTLYLIGDAKTSKLLRPLFLALLSEVIDRAYELANDHGGCLSKPLLVCLDEAGNVAPLPNLAEIASTAPSHGIQLVSIFHDLAQARSRYGRQAETVVNSHRARMLLPGVADLDTLRYFAGLIGDRDQPEWTRTIGAGGTSRSVGRRRLPLIAAEELRQLPDGHALLLYGRLAPVRVRLRFWFADRRLRRLQEGR